MKPFTVLVVDDEALARDELKFLLSSHQECRLIGEANDGIQALRLVTELQPEVVFLDIEMREMSGYEIAVKMLSSKWPPFIVFVTAYDEYAVGAFELGVVDYLLKPIESMRLDKTLDRISAIRVQSIQWEGVVSRVASLVKNRALPLRKFPVEKDGVIQLLDYSTIIYCRAQNGQVLIFSAKDFYFSTVTMNELENRLGETFMRVHKSYLINLAHVAGILPWFKGTYWLIMSDLKQSKIPVSKNKVKQLKASLGLEKY